MAQNERNGAEAQAMAERFGALSLTMLHDTPLAPAWRLSFLANFFVGPLYRELEQQSGLSRAEFVILFALSQQPAGQPGLMAQDVVRVTGLPKNSISRAVSELLAKGLIGRATDRGDKRAKVLTLTGRGREMLTEALPLFLARQSAMRAALTAEEAAAFDRLLDKIIYAMPAWVGPE